MAYPAAGTTTAPKKERTHYLYMAVIVAVVLGTAGAAVHLLARLHAMAFDQRLGERVGACVQRAVVQPGPPIGHGDRALRRLEQLQTPIRQRRRQQHHGQHAAGQGQTLHRFMLHNFPCQRTS